MLCGHRAKADGDCPFCRDSPLLDIRDDGVRELIREHDRRRRQSREQKFLWLAVIGSIIVVIAANIFIPNYQQLRRETMALPFFLDQILIMAAIGYVGQLLLSKLFPVKAKFAEVT
jgi:hypothetical protein